MEKLKLIIENAIKQELSHPSKLIGRDEMYGYSSADPSDSGLNVKIYLDDSHSYKTYNHPLYVIFDNGKNRNEELIPIIVENEPKLINNNFNLNISHFELKNIFKFIENNIELITELANEQIDIFDFYDSMISQKTYYKLVESIEKELLVEMSKIPPKRTGLPVPIWVQETKMDLQHGLRMKFQASPDQVHSDEYSSISLETFEFFNLPSKNCISNKNLRKIKRFVERNQRLLIDLAYAKISLKIFMAELIK